jgi:hypothetical protein
LSCPVAQTASINSKISFGKVVNGSTTWIKDKTGHTDHIIREQAGHRLRSLIYTRNPCENVSRSEFTSGPATTQPMNEPPSLHFDFDTLTLAQALPWFQGVAMILFGCLFAAFAGPFTDGTPWAEEAGISGNDLVTE